MRRKSERTASKKTKSSPEKKVEKPKRTRASRRRKQSTSSENESADQGSPEHVAEETKVEVPLPKTPVKEKISDEAQEQVWHVKTAQGDGGEISKLKICLTRPSSTPERPERSPKSKRKHSRATSSSDTPSIEGAEERHKTKHRSRKSSRMSNEAERSSESHNEDQDKVEPELTKTKLEATASETQETIAESQMDSQTDDTAVSTTEENKMDSSVESVEANTEEKQVNDSNEEKEDTANQSAEDTTVTSSKEPQPEEQLSAPEPESEAHSQQGICEPSKDTEKDNSDNVPTPIVEVANPPEDNELMQPKEVAQDTEDIQSSVPEKAEEVSKVEESVVPEKGSSSPVEDGKGTNDNDVLELEPSQSDRIRKMSTDSHKETDVDSHDRYRSREFEISESTHSTNEETTHNGEATPSIVVSRKRRWGSRPSKVSTQKSITISSDVLKDIIPDVKPVEFNEVIEEKKHPKRIDLTEKVERPILPKIVIDNTEHIELKKDQEDKHDLNVRDSHPVANNRRISIVNDNENITERPPSPPRNQQTCILYITNLVRPFTLPQLKNLLQRTGKIAEDGFWIDKIKSRCFVKYEDEEQAVETRHALHGVTWPVSNPKTLHVDFSTEEAFERVRNEETENVPASTIPGTVEDWLKEQDMKREKELEKPWERKAAVREWDMGKGDKGADAAARADERGDKRRTRSPLRSPEPVKKFKKKEEEAPAKLLDDLFRKTKTTPCIYWLPLSAETIAVKEEQRRQHMAEHERRMNELRRRRH